MKKQILVLIAVIIMSPQIFSQIKKLESILAIKKDTLYVYKKIKFGKIKAVNEKNFIQKLDIREIENYFNSIFGKANMEISIVSGGGYSDIRLNKIFGIRIKYGTLKLEESFSKVRGLDGEVFGINLGMSLKGKNNTKLFLSVGNDWISIENSKKNSAFNFSIGIKIKGL